MPNFKLILSYDGTRYRGWQRQGNTPDTLQGKLEGCLSRLLGQPVEAAGSGRTDAGVHARRQTVSFRAETALTPAELLSRLREVLPEDVGAESLEIAPPRFHARLSCKGKTYCYRVWNSAAPCVFVRRYVHRVPEKLDDEAMARAGALLEGAHDFSAFRTGKSKKSALRRLDAVRVRREEGELRFYFTGDGFLYNMARILAGTLLEVGAGRMTPEQAAEALASRDRAKAGPTAPARGLTLWETVY